MSLQKNRKLLLAAALVLGWLGVLAAPVVGGQGERLAVKEGFCADGTCRFLLQDREVRVYLEGIELPSLGGECLAEVRLYLLADQFLRELFEGAERIELADLGEERAVRSALFDRDIAARPAKVFVDGAGLSRILTEEGFAVSVEPPESRKSQPGGLWCGPLP